MTFYFNDSLTQWPLKKRLKFYKLPHNIFFLIKYYEILFLKSPLYNKIVIGSGNCLVPSRRQAINCTNDEQSTDTFKHHQATNSSLNLG